MLDDDQGVDALQEHGVHMDEVGRGDAAVRTPDYPAADAATGRVVILKRRDTSPIANCLPRFT